MLSFDDSFDVSLSELLDKQSSYCWYGTCDGPVTALEQLFRTYVILYECLLFWSRWHITLVATILSIIPVAYLSSWTTETPLKIDRNQ